MAEQPLPEDVSRSVVDAFQAQHPEVPDLGSVRAGPPAYVLRLDRPGGYLLVPIYGSTGLRGIVQLDAERHRVESSAAIRDPAAGFLTAADDALRAARQALPDRREWRAPFLGWRPCHESFDSMRPLWVVPHSEGRAFVTQSGAVFEALTVGKGG